MQVQINEGQQMCMVCNDVANGIHFGALTCEGCKVVLLLLFTTRVINNTSSVMVSVSQSNVCWNKSVESLIHTKC